MGNQASVALETSGEAVRCLGETSRTNATPWSLHFLLFPYVFGEVASCIILLCFPPPGDGAVRNVVDEPFNLDFLIPFLGLASEANMGNREHCEKACWQFELPVLVRWGP